MFAARAAFMAGRKAGLNGSASLNSSSYIDTPTSSVFSLGTNDFTIELWYYLTSTPSNAYLFDFGSNGTRIQLFSNNAYFIPQSGSYVTGTAGAGFSTSTWHHIAMTRSGSTVTGWVNGSSVGSVTNSFNGTETTCRIGNYGGGTIGVPGYISNFRVINAGDGALYSSTFTPPSSALTSRTGTKLLACQDPDVIKDNGPNAFSLTISGATASSFGPFS